MRPGEDHQLELSVHVPPAAVHQDCSHEHEEVDPLETALVDGVCEEHGHDDHDGEVVTEPGEEEASPPALDTVASQTVDKGRC